MWERKDWRYALLMGGRGNGRSGTASRYTISQLLSKEYTRGAIMRATREDIRASSWQALNDRLVEQKAENIKGLSITDGDMIMSYGQNSLRAFGFRASSGSLTARLKSLEGISYIWIEEAEEIGEEEFIKLDDTLRTIEGRIRIVLTLNTPPKNHWIIKRWFDLEPHPEAHSFYTPTLKDSVRDVLYIGGTYRENEVNMDPSTVERYKSYKKNKPSHYWGIIEGLSAETVQGLIYSGWKEIPEVPHEARLLGHFLDFGGGSAPDAIGTVYYHNGGYIVDERYYEKQNSYDSLIEVCRMLEPAPIVADAAEDRMVRALNQAGINILTTDKGPGSVRFGIKLVQGLKISYTTKSTNLKREYENYAWLFNKDGDNKDIPDPNCKHKFGDHCFVGDTEIFTTKGKTKIIDLVGKEGYLYSRGGQIQRYSNVRPTRNDVETLLIEFSDDKTIEVTPDHYLLCVDGLWRQVGVLRPTDIIQCGIYESGNYISDKIKVQWNKLLSTTGTHDTRASESGTRAHGKNKTVDKSVAQFSGRKGLALTPRQNNLQEKKARTKRMCSLPYKIYNYAIRYSRSFLPFELQNEGEAKTIKRITRRRAAVVYNLEVENTECMVANGVVAHNCLDGLRYFAEKMITAGADPDADERQSRLVQVERRKKVESARQDFGL